MILSCIRLPFDWKLRTAEDITPRTVKWQGIFASVHPVSMGFAMAAAYLKFGFDPLTFVGTVVLVGYTFGALVLMRPNLRVSYVVSAGYLLMPGLAALWLGGFAGYAIGAHLLAVMLFCFHQGREGNAEFWALLHTNRDLQMARRKAEESVHREAELMAQHSRQSVIAGERARIAAEWHDTLLAGFSAIGWQLDVAEQQLPGEARKSAEAMKVARTMVKHYSTESRLVIADMQSSVRNPNNLQAAIEQALGPVSQDRAVKVEVTVSGEPAVIASDKTHQLIRICQEAVLNALQHANAQTIEVAVRNGVGAIELEICDDGSGFEGGTGLAGHYGLEIMKDRARRIGGTLTIETRPGSGTSVKVRLPTTRSALSMRINVLIVEDQYFSRLALRSVLESRSEFSIVGEAGTGGAGVGLFRQHAPDITLVDLRLPDISGVEVIRAIRLIDPHASLVVVSNFDDSEHKRQASEAGAAAFLNKSASSAELLETITKVVADKGGHHSSGGAVLGTAVGGGDLTGREYDVLEQLVLGYSNGAIGARLGISEKVVDGCVANVLAKLGVQGRGEAAAAALERGMVERTGDGLHG